MSSPEYEQLLLNLKRLRLGSLTESLEGHLKRAAATNMSYQDFLSGLVHEALEHRQQRGVALRIKKARFPFQKRLEDFDFDFQPSFNRQKVKALASLKFVDQRENVIFLGPPGVGKTHLAVALGLEACQGGYKVAFTTLHDLVNELHASLADRSLAEKLQALGRPHILIIDEVGYLPLDKERANYFFQVVARRYEQGSVILTSNKSFPTGILMCYLMLDQKVPLLVKWCRERGPRTSVRPLACCVPGQALWGNAFSEVRTLLPLCRRRVGKTRESLRAPVGVHASIQTVAHPPFPHRSDTVNRTLRNLTLPHKAPAGDGSIP